MQSNSLLSVFQRMCARPIAAALAALLLAAPVARAQSEEDALPVTVWTIAGDDSGPGYARLITVTPASSPASIIQQLKARPVGSRGLLLTGFANDITTRETIRRRRAATTAAVPSPWVDKGIATVRARVNNLMVRLMRANAQVEFVVVQCDASLRAAEYDQYGAPGWRAIQTDSRFAAVRTAIGSVDFVAEMTAFSEVRAAWDRYFDASLDNALHKAIVTTTRRYFPNAQFVAQNRYSLPASSIVTSARNGGGFGNYDQPQFYLQGTGADPFASLGVILTDVAAIRAASGRAVVPSIPTPSWTGGGSGLPAFSGSAYWSELVYHLRLTGAPSILMDRGVPSGEELAMLRDLIAAVQERAGGLAISPYVSSASVDADVAVASAIQAGGTVHWRLTAAPGVASLRITFTDDTTQDVAIEPGSVGAWFDHPDSQQIAFIQTPGEGGGGSG
ncbi:MAG: hypothetical protein JNK53_05190, partial [Phycisphaerae bacterium]|nr:hypothetical protein [Phycisphaerae bacterium]